MLILLACATLSILIVLRTVMAEASVTAMIATAVILVGVVLSFGLAFRASKALLIIYPDRAVVDLRPQGGRGLLEVRLLDLRSVMFDRQSILLRLTLDRTIVFHGDRLHAEDAFDVLVTNIENANPDCMILRR